MTMVNANRIVIFSGGNLDEWALKEIHEKDYIIGVDRGALFLVNNAVTPDLVVGDFDSVSLAELNLIKESCNNIAKYDQNKDYTDTELAFHLALEKRPKEILMLGVTGTRFDHSFANVQLLYNGLKEDILCRIIDKNNEIRIIDKSITINKGEYTHVSLLPFSLQVTGVTLEGFRYPLNNRTLCAGESIGISNILEEELGKILLDSGALLVIKSKD